MATPDTLEALKDAYRFQYHFCCHLKTEVAYTYLTAKRYRAQNMAQTLGIPFSEGDFLDPTKHTIQACIARCEALHTALVTELRGEPMVD